MRRTRSFDRIASGPSSFFFSQYLLIVGATRRQLKDLLRRSVVLCPPTARSLGLLQKRAMVLATVQMLAVVLRKLLTQTSFRLIVPLELSE
jgi:hypothetical protein